MHTPTNTHMHTPTNSHMYMHIYYSDIHNYMHIDMHIHIEMHDDIDMHNIILCIIYTPVLFYLNVYVL